MAGWRPGGCSGMRGIHHAAARVQVDVLIGGWPFSFFCTTKDVQ
jgi:hypothetical protein